MVGTAYADAKALAREGRKPVLSVGQYPKTLRLQEARLACIHLVSGNFLSSLGVQPLEVGGVTFYRIPPAPLAPYLQVTEWRWVYLPRGLASAAARVAPFSVPP